MFEEIIKVYIKVNEQNIVTNINSNIFLENIDGYIEIDTSESGGDRYKYAHAQGNYLDKPLIDEQSRYNYKYVDNEITKLTEEEKQALFPPIEPQPSEIDQLKQQLEEQKKLLEEQNEIINTLLGVKEVSE